MHTLKAIVIPALALFAVACEHGTPDLAGPGRQGSLAQRSSVETARLSSARKGDLLVTKACLEYFGAAGEHCTVTSSNIAAIMVGSPIVYLSALNGNVLDSDIIIRGAGNDAAFGHVYIDFANLPGSVTIWGGTGRLTGFHAKVSVIPLGKPEDRAWTWKGKYHFSNQGKNENDGDEGDEH